MANAPNRDLSQLSHKNPSLETHETTSGRLHNDANLAEEKPTHENAETTTGEKVVSTSVQDPVT